MKRLLILLLCCILALSGCRGEPVFVEQSDMVEITVDTAQPEVTATPAPTPTPPPGAERILPQPDRLELAVGETGQLTCAVEPANAVYAPVTYSAQGDLLSVDETGLVTARKAGQGEVIVSTDGVSAAVPVTVRAIPWESVTLPQEETLGVGDKLCPVQILPENATLWDAVYTSSDESVLQVTPQGEIIGISKGSATLQVTLQGEGASFSADCEVTVTRGAQPDQVELAPARYTKQEDGSYTNGGSGDRATLFCLGDLMCLGGQQKTARTDGGWDFTGSFSQVKDLFSQADLVIGNLETVTAHSYPYTSEYTPAAGEMPFCNAPSSYVEALRWCGVDGVVTSNNHCVDCGKLGIRQTLEQLERYELFRTGIGLDVQAPPYVLAQVNGIRVGFLSYSTAFNGKHRRYSEQEQDALLHRYTEENVKNGIAAAKAAGAEYVVVYIHWGTENVHEPDGKQRDYDQAIADAGADFIVGSHPHVLQPATVLTSADGRQVPCVYSMGNFVSSMASTANNDTIVLSMTLGRTEQGVVLESWGYYPCRVFSRYEGNRRVVVPCYVDGSDEDLQEAAERIARIMGEEIAPIWPN